MTASAGTLAPLTGKSRRSVRARRPLGCSPLWRRDGVAARRRQLDSFVTLIIAPHPNLSVAQAKAIAIDFGSRRKTA